MDTAPLPPDPLLPGYGYCGCDLRFRIVHRLIKLIHGLRIRPVHVMVVDVRRHLNGGVAHLLLHVG